MLDLEELEEFNLLDLLEESMDISELYTLLLKGNKTRVAHFVKHLEKYGVDNKLCEVTETSLGETYSRTMEVKAGSFVLGEKHNTGYDWAMGGDMIIRELNSDFGEKLSGMLVRGSCKEGVQNLGMCLSDVSWTTYHKVPEDVPLEFKKDWLQGIYVKSVEKHKREVKGVANEHWEECLSPQ